MRNFVIFWILILISVRLAAQSPTFEATTNSKTVDANSTFSISFKYSGNKEISDFKAPDFSPFRAMGNAGIARSSTIINGRASNEYRYTYTLAAPGNPGTYTIPPATINEGGKSLVSNPIEIKVQNIDPARLKELEQEAFIEIKLSKDTAYIGEPIKMDVNLYFRKYNIDNLSVVGQLNYDDFISEGLVPNNYRNTTSEINGLVFQVQNLGSRILYPRKTGKLSLGQLILQANQVLKSESFGFMRTNTEVRPIQLKSKEVDLLVIDIPRPAPEDFIGAIGKLDAEFKISKQHMGKGDGFTLWTTVKGNSDINRISIPQYSLGENFEIYTPKVVREESDVGQNNITNYKIFEHVCIAKEEGSYNLKFEFSYFDTEIKDYVRLNQGFAVEVKGEGASSLPSILESGEEGSKEVSALGWLGIGVATLVLLGAFLWYRRRREEEMDKLKVVMPSVKSSDERLTSAVDFLNTGREKQFYDEIYRLWTEFVIRNCELPQSELNLRSMKAALRDKSIPLTFIDKLESILKVCDLSLYGKLDKSEEMEAVLRDCEELLRDLDKEFKREMY